MTPTATPEEILNTLKQRITDGDETVTAAELQQAETAVEIATLQNKGRERRAAKAEHQARLDELKQIRAAVENDLPNRSKKLASLLTKIDKSIEEAVTLASEHDQTIAAYSSRIRALQREGAVIDGLEVTADSIIAGNRNVGLIGLDAHITRAAKFRHEYPSRALSLADGYKPADRAHADNNVIVTILKPVGGHRKDDTVSVTHSQAERMIEGGYAEPAN